MERKQFIIGSAAIVLMPQLLLPKKRKPPEPPLTPKEEWETYATDDQKAYALKCIQYGQQHRLRLGHTLAGLAWMESSLGAKTDHGEERSYGPFGMGLVTANHIRKKLRKNFIQGDLADLCDETVIMLLEDDFAYAAVLAMFLFEYHRQWFLSKKYSPQQSWKFAAQKYAGWKRWRSREKYGRVFNDRVKFLKTNTDWGEV